MYILRTLISLVWKRPHNNSSWCVFKDTRAINSMNSLLLPDKGLQLVEAESHSGIFFRSSLWRYFYQSGWERLVLERKGSALQPNHWHLSFNKTFTCLCLFVSVYLFAAFMPLRRQESWPQASCFQVVCPCERDISGTSWVNFFKFCQNCSSIQVCIE